MVVVLQLLFLFLLIVSVAAPGHVHALPLLILQKRAILNVVKVCIFYIRVRQSGCKVAGMVQTPGAGSGTAVDRHVITLWCLCCRRDVINWSSRDKTISAVRDNIRMSSTPSSRSSSWLSQDSTFSSPVDLCQRQPLHVSHD